MFKSIEKLKEIRKPSLKGFLFKKLITSAYSKSSNSSGFNPILPKFCETICEITVLKTVCGTFLIFCRSKFGGEQFFGTLKSPKLKYIDTYLFKKNILRTALKIASTKISWNNFFFQKSFFPRTWSFFNDCKTTDFDLIFFHKKINFIYFFFKSDYLILI